MSIIAQSKQFSHLLIVALFMGKELKTVTNVVFSEPKPFRLKVLELPAPTSKSMSMDLAPNAQRSEHLPDSITFHDIEKCFLLGGG